MPVIYALSHVPPEVSAYGMAKYSRSSASMRDSLLELSQQKAQAFLNTFYFSYGHASIADLAHVPLAVEDISLLAAMEVVDEPLWDGQERSTRYQDFSESPYYTPANVPDSYSADALSLFALYRSLFADAETHLKHRHPKPDAMKPLSYGRTIRARAFDLARFALPLATLTSLGQVTNARVLELQIRRLMASPLAEIRHIADGMRAAATEIPPFNLLEARLHHLGIPVSRAVLDEMNPGPITPTLTKYTDPDDMTLRIRARVKALVRDHFSGVTPAQSPVELHRLGDPMTDLLAGLVYQESALSYQAILTQLAAFSEPEKRDLVGEFLAFRGPHDAWPRAFQQRPLIFDVVIDVGAFRDLNRHRRLDKIAQNLDPRLGYDVPPELDEANVAKSYRTALQEHYTKLAAYHPAVQPYLLPLGHRRRVLLRMDFAQAAYLIELRSRSSGHFSYRRIANAMHAALLREFPTLTGGIRVTPMADYDPFER